MFQTQTRTWTMFSSVQSLDQFSCQRDMWDDSAEILFQSFLQQALVSSSGMGRDVHFLMLSIQHSSSSSLLPPPSSSVAVKHEPCLLTLRKGSRPSKQSAWGNFSACPTWSTRPMTGCGARSTPLWVHRNLFWKLSRDGNLHGLSTSLVTTASPKPSFRASLGVGNAVVGRENAG